jgi:C2 domain
VACAGYPFDKLVQSTLCLQVLDYDRFSKDDVIGEVILPMTAFDLNNGHETSVWKNLQPSQRLLVSMQIN